ncbi:hypothetical protein CANINC_003339 [Pichia inconspicua]|uniref:Peptidase A1 domain-containing protein n=1 Tax=Pichia inconspicua TaxID=52247 RepID=A0A4T0WZ38_9ASCO|nr:hypothetical protein CANINC_003339 [[Candida] inconspicua]
MINLPLALITLIVLCFAQDVPERVANQHKRETSEFVQLNVDMINNEPIAKFLVGSELDPVSVIVDTGSSDFWVPSKLNTNCAPNDFKTNTSLDFQIETWGHMRNTYYINCSIYGTFDPTLSTSVDYNNSDFSVVYSSFQYAYGSYLQEIVINEEQNLGMLNLAVANTSSEGVGILGIGALEMEYTALKQNYTYANFPFQLVNNGKVGRASYSIYLNETKGEILFGAVDHSKYTGTLLTFPMIDLSEFETYKIGAITMNSLGIEEEGKNKKLFSGFVPVLIDSGSSQLQFPQKMMNAFIDELNLQKVSSNIFITNCNNLKAKKLTFEFHGSLFGVPLSDNFVKTSGNQCALNISFTSNNYIVLGNNFMKQYYTIFDWEDRSISIAKATNSTQSNIDSLDEPLLAKSPPLDRTYGGSHTTFVQVMPSPTFTALTSSSVMSITTTSLSAYGTKRTTYSFCYTLLSLLIFFE